MKQIINFNNSSTRYNCEIHYSFALDNKIFYAGEKKIEITNKSCCPKISLSNKNYAQILVRVIFSPSKIKINVFDRVLKKNNNKNS